MEVVQVELRKQSRTLLDNDSEIGESYRRGDESILKGISRSVQLLRAFLGPLYRAADTYRTTWLVEASGGTGPIRRLRERIQLIFADRTKVDLEKGTTPCRRCFT